MLDLFEWPIESKNDFNFAKGKVKIKFDQTISSTVKFSECLKYRSVLTRTWDEKLLPIMFIGMNPSTADINFDDPTIRKEVTFAKMWAFGKLIKCNVMDFRSTYPKDLLLKDVIPQREENLKDIEKIILENQNIKIVAAWGKIDKKLKIYEKNIIDLLIKYNVELWCLGTNKDGSPKHPLYIKGDTILKLFKGKMNES